MLCCRRSQLTTKLVMVCLAFTIVSSTFCPAMAGVARQDNSALADQLNIPLCIWESSEHKPRCVVVAIHGTMMHGATFDSMARQLASQGVLVVAPDLRGYGRWYKEPDRWGGKRKISYAKSLRDVEKLIASLKTTYPSLPVVCLGESLGANLSARLAAMRPELIDGMILSSPCLKPRIFAWGLLPNLSMKAISVTIAPWRQFSLKPQARNFLKHEPSALKAYLDDPMTRKSLTLLEYHRSASFLNSTKRLVPVITDELPILILLGNKDCICKEKPVRKFVNSFHKEGVTIRHISAGGHILLQTSAYNPDMGNTLLEWIQQKCDLTPNN